jgi:hypothetical protein
MVCGVLALASGCSDADEPPRPAGTDGSAGTGTDDPSSPASGGSASPDTGSGTGGATSADGSGGTVSSTGGSDSDSSGGSDGSGGSLTMTGELVPIENGGVGGAAGLEGYWYTFASPDGTISPENFTQGGSGICVTGSQPAMGNWSTNWGVAIAWVLNHPFADAEAGRKRSLWNAVEQGVVGFEFALTGPNPPKSIRMDITANYNDEAHYCKVLTPPGPVQARFDELRLGCDGENPGTGQIDPTKLDTLAFFIGPEYGQASTFDFCITPVAVLKQ